MLYNHYTKPRVSNVLWYANVEKTFPYLTNHCCSCYRTAYDDTVNQGRKNSKARNEARLFEAVRCSI